MNPPEANIPAGKILVIDDNPIIQKAMHFALQDKGHTIFMCGDITDALKIVREQKIDVILLDINFPPDSSILNVARDGFWALEWIKRLDPARNTAIVVVSSDPPEKSRAQAIAAGAAAYFQKPIDKQELVTTIASLLASKAAGKA